MNKNESWGGVMSCDTDANVQKFGASVGFDKNLYEFDIQCSIAHADMLSQCNIISKDEFYQIKDGLCAIKKDIESGVFVWKYEYEDVHMNIEKALIDKIGNIGKKLHTARSRNDQVATDIRLYLMDATKKIQTNIYTLCESILFIADKNTNIIMPGFTHLQTAQPINVGFHLMAWFEMLYRDAKRLKNCHKSCAVMPLGSAALAGTSYPINRDITAKLLGFSSVSNNAMDAVSDRDFALEFHSFASILMMHLSRFCEEIIIWSSAQFRFITMSDKFSTGSSIMPQKKNPDIAELVRGKTGRVYGNLLSLLTIMKSQPLAYNKDNQEDKESLFDTVNTIIDSTRIFNAMIRQIKFNKEILQEHCKKGYMTATDLADYLSRKNVAFRDAHHITGKIVALCIKKNIALEDLSLKTLQKFHPLIQDDVYKVLSPLNSMNARLSYGGTSQRQTQESIKRARVKLHKIISV
jgi:argininosuccinate lyase